MNDPALAPLQCVQCGSEVARSLLACPSCGRLVHAEELKQVAGEAEALTQSGDRTEALERWRHALGLLPSGTRQFEQIAGKVAARGRDLETNPQPGAPGAKKSLSVGAGTVGTVGLLLWKLKFVLAFALGQGKFLLLGLTKASTLLSMLLSFGVYWTAFGWRFALGLLLSIYVHEMGHVFALRRYGIPATAPMFIPGVGALIRLKQHPVTAREDARVGLAGPIWGLAAAGVAYGVSLATGWGSWAAIAHVGAWINLFNLLPFGSLDGGRAFNALTKSQRLLLAGVIFAAWFLSGESLLLLLGIAAVMRATSPRAPAEPDRWTLITFALLIAILSALARVAS